MVEDRVEPGDDDWSGQPKQSVVTHVPLTIREMVDRFGADVLAEGESPRPVVNVPDEPVVIAVAGACASSELLRDTCVARGQVRGLAPITWSVRMLWPHLVDYYATRGSHSPKVHQRRYRVKAVKPSGAL